MLEIQLLRHDGFGGKTQTTDTTMTMKSKR